jgi:curved DNA-binding protein
MPVTSPDYYEVLGVPRDASLDDVRQAYRKLARKLHPDVNKEPGAEDRFKAVSEAYDVLRDPDKRAQYDTFGTTGAGAGTGSRGGPGFSAGNGSGGVSFDFSDADLRGDGFSDLLEQMFSGRSRPGGAGFGFGGSSGGRNDQEAVLELDLEEAARGGSRRLDLGDGRTISVDIPAGTRDGQLLRVPGQGGPGVAGGAPGDLLLRIRIRPNRRFRVDGADLHVDLPVSPWEAALGAEVPVQTLDGRAKVKVPAGSSSGRKLRLRGQGLQANGGRRAGDLYATVSIRVPKRLTKRERELFGQLASESKFDPRKNG